MAKPTTRRSAKVKIYNNETRMIGCYIPPMIKAHPPRHVAFKPGNNTIAAADWEALRQNEVFMANFKPREYLDRIGKKVIKIRLELGKADDNQSAEEIEFAKRVDAARELRRAEAPE